VKIDKGYEHIVLPQLLTDVLKFDHCAVNKHSIHLNISELLPFLLMAATLQM
jgi:hypothetical protein